MYFYVKVRYQSFEPDGTEIRDEEYYEKGTGMRAVPKLYTQGPATRVARLRNGDITYGNGKRVITTGYIVPLTITMGEPIPVGDK